MPETTWRTADLRARPEPEHRAGSVTPPLPVGAPPRSVAVVGLGAMGSGMALRLLERGFSVTASNRTAAKAEALAASGVVVASAPSDAVRDADVVVVTVSDERALEEVTFGPSGIGQSLTEGSVFVNASTVSPRYVRELAGRLAPTGAHFVEACLIGNPQQARAGELRLFSAGEVDAVEAVRAVLAAIARQVTYLGTAGKAATMKLVFNVLLGAQVASLAEAVCYGERAGLGRTLVLDAIAHSGFSSRVMAFRCELMRDARYEPPGFRASLMEKDLRIALDEAESAGIHMPVVAAAAERFRDTVAGGLADLDAAAILLQQHDDFGRPQGRHG